MKIDEICKKKSFLLRGRWTFLAFPLEWFRKDSDVEILKMYLSLPDLLPKTNTKKPYGVS